MTTRWPCLIVTALCCVLALATSASAECAWLMWGQPGLEYLFVSAHGSLQECDAALDAKGRLLARSGYSEIGGRMPGGHMIRAKAKDGRTTLYQCVPDIVDPRVPKGK